MGKGSDNPYPSLLVVEGTAPASPAAGQQRLFIDSADHTAKVKNSSGTVSSLGGGSTVTDATISTSDVTTNNVSTSKHGWAPKGDGNAAHYLDGTGAYSTPAGGSSGNFGTVQRALVDPTGLSWSWVNQGIASVATSGATIYLSSAANSADDWHLRIKALANSKPYTEIFHINPMALPGDFAGVGVGWLDSATNKFVGSVQFSQSGAWHLASSKSNTNYIVTANYSDLTGSGEMWKWIALCDDVTNRRIYVSRDGNNWVLMHSVGTNDFLTPDRIFFGLESRNATNAIGMLVDSLDAHTGSTP